MDKVEVLAPDKVRFTLKEPDSTFTNLLTYIDIISTSVSADKIATEPIGTGAFKFSEWLPNESFKLVRNDKYRLADHPYLDAITYKPMPDSEARIASLLAGDIDWDFEVAIKDIARVATTKGINVIKSESGSLGIFYLNMNQPPFNDKRIRQALLFGFDRQGYNRDFQTGLARVTNSPIGSSNWGYNPDVDKMYPYDTTKAKDLLKEAGFSDGKGLQIEVIYPVGLEEYKTISEYFQSMMNDIGVKVNVVGMELAAWSNKIIKEKTYQIAYDVRDVAVTEPADPYNDFTFTKPDKENFDGFTEEMIPGYLDLIKQGVAETDQAKRKDIYFKLQQMWADELPGWIISAAPQFWVTHDWVIDLNKSGLPPYRLYETWLNK
jgi:ABC-type transport system substrate-binding protein